MINVPTALCLIGCLFASTCLAQGSRNEARAAAQIASIRGSAAVAKATMGAAESPYLPEAEEYQKLTWKKLNDLSKAGCQQYMFEFSPAAIDNDYTIKGLRDEIQSLKESLDQLLAMTFNAEQAIPPQHYQQWPQIFELLGALTELADNLSAKASQIFRASVQAKNSAYTLWQAVKNIKCNGGGLVPGGPALPY
jgi:hypothetical protein